MNEPTMTGEPRDVSGTRPSLESERHRRDLPVYVSEHAIRRLHERIPIVLDLPLLHQMAVEALAGPKLQPTEGADGFLVEVGPARGRRVTSSRKCTPSSCS